MIEQVGTELMENISPVSVIAFIVNLIVIAVVVTRSASKTEISLRAEIAKSREDLEDRQDTFMRHIGESLTGVREKIREVELFCRDTFLRRDSFQEVNKQNLEAVNNLGSELKSRLERMETKLDQKT